MAISAPSRIHLVPIIDKVNIFWNDPDKVESKRYVIQRSPNAQGAFTTIHTRNPVTTTQGLIAQERSVDREHADTGLAPGTYDYRIRSEANGEFMVSNVFTVVVGGGIDYHVAQAGQDTAARSGSVSQPWGSLAYAMSRVSEGQQHRINFTGDFDITNSPVTLKRGVSIRGTGENTSIVRFYRNVQYDEGVSAFFYEGNGTTTNLNAEYSDFWVDGGNKQGRHAFVVRDARGYRFSNMKVTKTFMAGIQPRGLGEFFSIVGGTIDGCGYTPPKQAGDTWINEGDTFHAGGIWLKGSFNDFAIRNVNAIYMEGYWLKISPSYERLAVPGDYSDPRDKCTDSIVHSITGVGGLRSWAGTQAPEFPLEIWLMDSDRMLFHNMNMQNQFSLEHKNRERPVGTYSIAVWDSYIQANKAAAVELSNSDISVDNCLMDFRSSVGFDEAMGDFNQKPNNEGASDITISRSLFLMGNSGSPFISSRNRYTNLKVLNCGISYTGASAPGTLLNMVRVNGNNNTDWPGLQVRNTWVSVVDNGGTMQLIRRTGNNTVGNDGDGIPALTNAQFTHITTNRILGASPTGSVTINNMVSALPQLVGGSDIRQAFKPLPAGNLVDTGIAIGLPFAGSVPDRGWFETGLSGGAGNQLPQIVVAPLAASITQGTSIIVNYTVTDSDGTVANTKLVVNGVETETDSVAPFAQFIIAAPVAGTYQVAVRATDNAGGVSTSAAQTVLVRGANVLPAVSLSPLNSQYPTGGTVLLEATAGDSDGTVAKVEFFAGSTKIGEKLTAPYTLSWQPATGSYSLTARATDNDGASTTSTARFVTVAVLQSGPFVARNIGGIGGNAAPVTVNGRTYTAHLESAVKSGVSWENPGPGNPVFNPATDSQTEILLRSYVAANAQSPVVIEEVVPNGRYTVSVWAFEDNAPGPFDLTVQGTKVLTQHLLRVTGAAGTWEKLGPFTADVVNGILRIEGGSGPMNMSGYEIDVSGGTVSLDLSSSGNSVSLGQSVILTAAPVLPSGTTANKVEFFDGLSKVGEDLAAPYSIAYTPPIGVRVITARLTDNLANVYVSNAVAVNVAAVNAPPTGSIVAPTQVTAKGVASFMVSAADDTGLGSIQLFAGSILIAEVLLAVQGQTPVKSGVFALQWQNVPAGSHIITARITDTQNAVAVTAPVTMVAVAGFSLLTVRRFSFRVAADGSLLVSVKRTI